MKYFISIVFLFISILGYSQVQNHNIFYVSGETATIQYNVTVNESYLSGAIYPDNSGYIPKSNEYYDVNTNVVLATRFPHVGDNFVYYSWDSLGVNAVSSFILTSDTTVYAIFDDTVVSTVEVSMVSKYLIHATTENSGSLVTSIDTLDFNIDVDLDTVFVVTGANFVGYSTDSLGNNIISTLHTYSDTTLYAIFSLSLDNIIAWIDFEEADTTLIDSAFLYEGRMMVENTRVAGLNGDAVTLTGTGYGIMDTLGSNTLGEVSLSAWVKPTTSTGAYQGVIMHGGVDFDTYAMYLFEPNQRIAFKTTGTTGFWQQVDGIDLWDGSWHHIAATYDGTIKKIYVDSVLVDSLASTGNIVSGDGYNLMLGAGRDGTPDLFYYGILDEVRVFAEAKTYAEVGKLYNSGSGIYYSDWINYKDTIADYMRVTYPNGGESIVSGTSVIVRWNSNYSGNVNVEFSSNNGSSYTMLDSARVNSGTYSWIPTTISDQYLIKVTATDSTALFDTSNAVFSVVSGGSYPISGDYFVDNTGTGDTLTYAELQTKVSTGSLVPGDTISLKAGLEYRGTLDINYSGTSGDPIVIRAYGDGDRPKIYGSELVTGTWSVYSGNIYSINLARTITQVVEDGVKLRSARYPNTGYATLTSVASSTNVTASSLPNVDHTGSTMYIRTAPWALESRTVTNSTNTNTTLTLSSAIYYTYVDYLRAGHGIFLTNNLEYLDEAGEWYSDGTTLYAWFPDGTSPSDNEVRVTTTDNIIDITNQSYVTLENLDIQQASLRGVLIENSDYITLDSLNIKNAGIIGIEIDNTGSSYCTIKESTINGAYGFGIRTRGNNHLIQDNTIQNIGLFDDIGLGGTSSILSTLNGQTGVGVYLTNGSGGGSEVRYNTIQNIGYNGIWFYDNPSTLIEYNFIEDACLVIDDGAGIYSFGNVYAPAETVDNSIVRYNIIDGVLGTLEGSDKTRKEGNGIYTDQNVRYQNVHDNVIANVTEGGIKQHDNDYVYARNNILFDCGIGLNPLSSSATTHMKSNIVLNTADVVPREGSQGFLGLAKSTEVVQIDSNAYYEFHVTYPFRMGDTPFSSLTFAQWQSMLSDEANSTFDGTALGAGEVEILFYNASKVSVAQDLSGYTWRDLDGSSVTSLTLLPYTGQILIRE